MLLVFSLGWLHQMIYPQAGEVGLILGVHPCSLKILIRGRTGNRPAEIGLLAGGGKVRQCEQAV